MRKILIFLIIITAIFSGIRFCLGVYIHDGFGNSELFIKHRPIWKWKFYSPIGMSDLQLKDLPDEKKEEQLLFKEFVTDQGLSR